MTPDDIQFLPPGVSEAFADASGLGFGYVTDDYLRTLILPRREDAHKGTYGHALLVCGSEGMVGAAVLATGVPIHSDSFSPDSPENVQLFLEGFGAQVSEFTIPD